MAASVRVDGLRRLCSFVATLADCSDRQQPIAELLPYVHRVRSLIALIAIQWRSRHA
jgi:hypothetical protein